ncbi:hypothetical protein [Spirosoma flavum]|uniref:Uncharacterized protein n=1 Tax=Spirosoma flavum TaxID=2048557 RepID=A0ABW6API3_9BACT
MKKTITLVDERQLETIRFLVDLGAEQLIKSTVMRKKTAVTLTEILGVQKLLKTRNQNGK